MPRKEAGRRSLAKVTDAAAPVTAPGTSTKKSKAFVHLSTRPAKVNAVGVRQAAPRFPIRTSDAAAWAIATLVVGVFLIVGCVLLTLGAPS